MMKRVPAFGLALWLAWSPTVHAVFTDTGQVNPEIARTDPAIQAWASGVDGFDRGPMDYQNPGGGDASFGMPTDVLGPTGTPFSLGDGGWITLTFDAPIANGAGADLAVFENGFEFSGSVYMEIGFVEVSSDGAVFSRLPSICRRTTQPGSFEASDPADFYNLGGNYAGGTGIDLQDLVTAADPNVLSGDVDLSGITHVRIVDVIGHIENGGATQDYFGTPVADPYPTAFASGGMDLTGVGAINLAGTVATETTSWGRVKSLYAR
jgi:hypothetical protein